MDGKGQSEVKILRQLKGCESNQKSDDNTIWDNGSVDEEKYTLWKLIQQEMDKNSSIPVFKINL